ncbi:hypothetical protein [Bradyrhizobium sp.]|uniref:BP74-related protein n=1 Tax=Bradyrhizobium sp. TaxID=376 RepID=UPI0025BD68AB|nr:hypothetical protein [Bradyrhizobium sp.]
MERKTARPFWISALIWTVAVLGCSSLASAETRYFRVCPGPDPSGCGSPNDFIIALSKPKQIQMAMQILGGKVVDQVHVQGMIVAKPAAHNTPWKFHLAPKTISFFTFGHPVCWGFSTKDIGDHLDKLGTPDFLPTKQWCPRGYRLSQQVHPS